VPYLTPDEVPEGTVCRPLFIPDDTAWLSLVSGILTEGAKVWNWEQFGTLTPQECADVIQLIVDGYYDEPCGECLLPDGEKILTVDALGSVQELDSGSWQDPTGDYALPPVPARTEPTADERRCLAAKNLANVLEQVYEEMTDAYNLDLDPAAALTVFAGTWSTVVLVSLGFISLGLGTTLFGTWTLAYQALEFLTEDVWNEAFTDKLVCVLLSLATDDAGVVTFNWAAFQNRLAYQIDLGDPSLGELRLYAQILYMCQFVGVDGMNHAATTTEITDDDCTFCQDDGCYEWDFSLSNGGWFVRAAGEGVYVPGAGWAANCIPAGVVGQRVIIQLNVPTPTTININRCEAEVDYVLGSYAGGGDPRNITVRSFTGVNGGGSVLDTANAGTAPIATGTYEIGWTEPGGANPACLEVNSWSSQGSCNGSVLIRKVRIYYSGADVFGDPNCPPE